MTDKPVSPWMNWVQSRFSDEALSNISPSLHLETLEAEYASVEQALIEARRLRNRKAPVGKLPPELMLYIFKYYQSLCLRTPFDSGELIFHPSWTTITCVCSAWREIALNAPTLWATPRIDVLRYPQYMPAIASRSFPLALDLDLSTFETMPKMRRHTGFRTWFRSSPDRPHCERAKGLSLRCDDSIIEYVAACLPQMRYLRKLCLDVRFPWGAGLTVPRTFWEFHDINHLTLSGCNIPLNSPIFSARLVHLELYGDGKGPRENYQSVRELFACLTSLDSLTMKNIVPLVAPQDGPNLAIALPPTLRTLHVAVSSALVTTDCMKFMSNLRAPALCSRTFYVDQVDGLFAGDASSDNNLRRIFSQLASCEDVQSRAQHLHFSHNRVALASVVSPPELTETIPECTVEGAVVNVFGINDSDWMLENPIHDLTGILDHVGLDHLRVISLIPETLRAFTDNDLWKRLLRANNIRRIDIRLHEDLLDEHFDQLLLALCYRHTVTESGVSFLFPHLETLAIDMTGEYENDNEEFITQLVDLVGARSALGVPVQEIIIPKWVHDWEALDDLKMIVNVTALDTYS
ncbi:unnamed protein product [Peniophora sp. CBMAI 1063]|nr:unnamed protein product [Peniophora sp. CBMAI 1063]